MKLTGKKPLITGGNVVRVNLNGAFRQLRCSSVERWRQHYLRRIGTQLSGAGRRSRHAVAEGGLVAMARAIAADLAPRNIRVNVVALGATKTPIWKRGARASWSAEQSAKVDDLFSTTVPLGRWGEPEDVAKAVLFLASEDSSYINAVELMVDGGLTVLPSARPAFAVKGTDLRSLR